MVVDGVSIRFVGTRALKVGRTGEGVALERAVLLADEESSTDARRAADGKDHAAETAGSVGSGFEKTSGPCVLGGGAGRAPAGSGGGIAE